MAASKGRVEKNSVGLGLIEVLCTSAVASVLLLNFSSAIMNNVKFQRSIEAKSGLDNIHSMLKVYLTTGEGCTPLLKGSIFPDASPRNFTFTEIRFTLPNPSPSPSGSPLPGALVTWVNQPLLASGTEKITRIEIGEISPTVPGADLFLAQLKISASRDFGGDLSLRIPLVLDTHFDPTQNPPVDRIIDSCRGSSGSDELPKCKIGETLLMTDRGWICILPINPTPTPTPTPSGTPSPSCWGTQSPPETCSGKPLAQRVGGGRASLFCADQSKVCQRAFSYSMGREISCDADFGNAGGIAYCSDCTSPLAQRVGGGRASLFCADQSKVCQRAFSFATNNDVLCDADFGNAGGIAYCE